MYKRQEYCSLEKALNNKELFINSDMYSNIPTMMMPIVVKEEVIGFVALSNVKFEELTLHNETLFKITTKLVTGALSRAYKYEKAIIKDVYKRQALRLLTIPLIFFLSSKKTLSEFFSGML